MITLRVHARPKMRVLEHGKLPVVCQIRQRLPLKHAVLRGRNVFGKGSPKEEISAIDPGRVQFWLFDKLDEFVADHAKLAEARGRVDAEYGADLVMAQM